MHTRLPVPALWMTALLIKRLEEEQAYVSMALWLEDSAGRAARWQRSEGARTTLLSGSAVHLQVQEGGKM